MKRILALLLTIGLLLGCTSALAATSATTKMPIATRSGPGTQYTEPGTFLTAGGTGGGDGFAVLKILGAVLGVSVLVGEFSQVQQVAADITSLLIVDDLVPTFVDAEDVCLGTLVGLSDDGMGGAGAATKVHAVGIDLAVAKLSIFNGGDFQIYSISLRKLTLLYKPLTITFVQNVIGMIYFIPMVFIMEKVTPSNIMGFGHYILPLLSLGVFASSVAYTLWAFAFSKLGAAKANIYSNLIPVFTAIFSCIIIGENLTIQKILGILLVIGGLILSQLKFKKS